MQIMMRTHSFHPSRFALVVGGLLLCALSAWGHTLPISFLNVVADNEYVHVELMLNPFELNFFSELDLNRNGFLEPLELSGREESVARKIVDCVKLRLKGRLVTPEGAGIAAEIDGHHFTMRAHYCVDARRSPLTIECSLVSVTSGSHLTQVTYLSSGRRQFANLDQQTASVTFAPVTGVKVSSSSTGSHFGGFSSSALWSATSVALCAIVAGFLFISKRWALRRSRAALY